MPAAHHVVIVGGGFGGLHAAIHLRRAPVRVTLLDRRNFHLFQPLLYQVATGALSPANIASPLRRVLKRQCNARVLLAEVVGFHVPARKVILHESEIAYDTLIVATGVRHNYFGHDAWERHAPGLKTVEDATEIRRRILTAFESAERDPDSERRRAWLTFVVVGAGPTGVELAGALGEIARDTLRHDFRAIDPADARILLLDPAPRVLPSYPSDLSAKAESSLRNLGVTVLTGFAVADIGPGRVTVRKGEELQEIAAGTVLWAAGVQASPLGRALGGATGCPLDKAGRLMVEPDLSLPGHPEILVIGDLAHYRHQGSDPLPGIAPVAMQQGRYAARLIAGRLGGRKRIPAFSYKHRGSMATIGRAAAVADFGRIRLSGYPAWLAWLFIHLLVLVEYQNKLLVLVQWAWNYFTRNRAARLITGEPENKGH